MIEMITIAEACRIIGGNERPIHPATYYRGVAAGRYPAPVHVAPNISRIVKRELVAAIERLTEVSNAA